MNDRAGPRWFVRGDLDGFFGLALDNLIQVLVLLALTRGLLRFPSELVFGRMLPGIAVSLVIGNVFYALQARALAQRTGRSDVCALPYGINTVTLFAHVFLVMLPVKLEAMASQGLSEGAACERAFQAGLIATIGSGLVEAGGSYAIQWLRRVTPRAALLSTLAGIAVTFIAAGFLFRTFASPLVAFLPFGVVLLTYFGRVRFPFGIPGGLVAVLLGTTLAYATGLAHWDSAAVSAATAELGFRPPIPQLGSLLDGLRAGYFGLTLAVVVPMGLFNVVGSVQNLESASAAGDDYPTVPSLVANGVGTILGAAFGSPFPTTIYIGHPGWKALGARLGYSIINGVFFTVLGLSGAAALAATLIPIESGMAIVLWIGIVMVAQAYQATDKAHAPAVAVGLLPAIAAWGALMLKNGVRAAGGTFGPALIPALAQGDIAAHGLFALESGFLLTSIVWAAATTYILERRFLVAAAWALAGAGLSAIGMIHGYAFTPGDVVQVVQPSWQFAGGYALLAALLASAHWLPEDHGPAHE